MVFLGIYMVYEKCMIYVEEFYEVLRMFLFLTSSVILVVILSTYVYGADLL